MAKKSIDGLVRRTGSNARTVGFAPAQTKKRKATKTMVRHEGLGVDSTLRPVRSEQKAREVDLFLNEVKDEDPTQMIGDEKMTPRQKRKAEKRASKEAKRDAKRVGKKKSHKVRNIILSIIGVLLLSVLGVGTWLWWQGNELISDITGGGNLWDVITADPDVPLKKDPVTGRVNVLVFGTEGYSMDDPGHDGGHLTDSMLLLSIDQSSGDVRSISIPRDLKAKTCTATGKMNEVFWCTYRKAEDNYGSRREHEKMAAESLMSSVQEILGVEIQYFVHLNWGGAENAIDALGGIDVVFVHKGEAWDGPEVTIETSDPRGLREWCSKGTPANCREWLFDYPSREVLHLDGFQAIMGVARARNSNGGYGAANGNFSRELFQQRIIVAALRKAQQTNFLADFGKASEIKNAIGDNVRMNFAGKELKTVFNLAKKVSIEKMISVPLVDHTTSLYMLKTASLPIRGCVPSDEDEAEPCKMVSYVIPTAGEGNYAAIHEYVKKKLTLDPIIQEEAKVDVLNGTDIAGVAKDEGNRLATKNIIVSKIADAPAGEYAPYTLYYIGAGKDETKKVLEDLYGVKAKVKLPAGVISSADFVVIVGPVATAR